MIATQDNPTRDATRSADNLSGWHSATCRNFSLSECRGGSNAVLDTKISIQQLGPISLTSATSAFAASIELVRGPNEIKKDSRDHFVFLFVTRGNVDIEQDGRQAQLRQGDFAIYDQIRPFTLRFYPEGHQVLLVKIERPLLVSRIPRASNLTASRVAGDLKLGALSGSLALQFSQLGQAAGPEADNRLGASAVDVWSTVLESTLTKADQTPASNRRLEQVKRYLVANIHDGDLDVQTIANAQAMSSRTLNRLFVHDGTTPMRWLWRRRLDESYKALAEGQIYHVTDVASHFGFNDPSHFSRSFKKAFGRSPYTVRTSAQTADRFQKRPQMAF